MYNLIYSIIIRPIFQEVHNFFTVCPGEPYPPSSPQYNLHNSLHYCKPSRLHKKYVLFFTYTHYPQYSHWPCTRFMHTIFCLFFSKKQLYTDLSTLSTIFFCFSPPFDLPLSSCHFLYTCNKFHNFGKKYTVSS